MKRTKFKTGILAVVFCSLTFLFSGDGNSIYADEILTDTELPVGRFSFEEKTEEADDEDYESVEEDDVAEQSLLRMTGISADDWEKYGSDYFYEQLSDEEKKYWDDLDAICEKYLTTETDAVTTNTGTYRMKAISGSTLEKEKQKKVLRMFRYSKPQYYFLNATIYTITYSNKKVSMIFGIYPAFGKGADRMEETEKVKAQVDTWQKQIDECSTEDEKVQTIHDLIIQKVEYNHDLVNGDFATENTEYSQSVYSVLCTNKTVCAGYAQTFEMMCNGTGIDTVAVTSFDHEWNKIKLENNWYNVDCTWNDNGSDNVGYTYFLRNDDYYDTSSGYSKKHHAEESYWEGYLPATEMDSVGSPWISVNENASGSKIGMSCYNKEAEIYYTTDKSNPVTSGTRMLYQSDFLWNSSEYPVIKAAAMEDGKHNSAVVTKCLHNYNASILADAACEKAGTREYTCTICGNSYMEEIPATGHTVEIDPEVAAACETAGITEGSHCRVCGKVLVEQTVIPATGHTPVTDDAVAAACETTGLTEGSHCSVCEKVLTEQTVIPAAGHVPVTDAAVEAACETTGLTEGNHCSVCGKVLTAQNVIPATGHQWNEYKESGKIKRKCSVCGKTETVGTYLDVKKIQLSKTTYAYDGKAHMPTIKVTNTAGKKLKEGTDYKVKKPSGRKNAGIYTVTIVMKGKYSGKYQKTFQIVPKGTVISGVKAKKKAFTVSWKKQAKQTSGYQIQYAVDAKFKKSVVTKNVNNTKKTKLDVTKLKSKKKYYIRIRTYKTVKVNGKSKKIYSGWSKVKAVTTKK